MRLSLSGTLLRRYVEWITLHPWLVVGAVLGLTAYFVAIIPGRFYIENERKQQLPGNNAIIQLDDRILEIFGGGKFTLLAIEPKEGDIFQPWVLERIGAVTRAVQELPGVRPDQVVSITADKVKSIEAGGDEEILVRPLVEAMPQTPEEMESLRRRVMVEKLFVGYLVAPEGRAAAVVADIDDNDSNPELRNSVLDKRLRKIAADYGDERARVPLAGVPIFIANMNGYTRKVLWLFPLAVLVIGLVHYEAFRTLQAMFLPLVTALMSVAWGLGIFVHMNMPMDGWNALSPYLVLAVAAGHAVQILKRYYEEYRRLGDNRRAVVESTVKVGTVMITAGLIAAAGFLTLTLFPMRSIQVFGLLSASGILSALVIEMTFIPACRTLLPAPKTKDVAAERHGGLLETVLERLARVIHARPWVPLAAGGILVAAAVVGASRIEVENSFREALPADDSSIQDFDRINELFGGTVTLVILIEGEEPDAMYDPALLRAMEGMQAYLESIPGIGRSNSIADYVKQMNVAFHNGDEAFRTVPDSRQLIAQYFLLYSASGDPDDFDMVVDADYRRAVIRAYADRDHANFCEQILNKARAYADEHFPPGVTVGIGGGGLAVSKAVNDVVMSEKIRNSVVIAIIIFFISSLVLRSFVGGALVLLPSVFAAVVNLGIMGAVGSWLNLATASVSSLTISIGADYSIYFLFRFREEFERCRNFKEATLATMLTSGKAIFFVASAIASGSLVMAISPLAYHKQLGGYVAASMFTSALAAVTLVPAVVILLKPKFLQRPGWLRLDGESAAPPVLGTATGS